MKQTNRLLSPQQRSYVLSRINEAFDAKRAKIVQSCTVHRKLTSAQILREIQHGNCELRCGVTLSTPIGKAFDLNCGESTKLNDKRCNSETSKLKKQVAAIRDEIMLGVDSPRAAKLMQGFCDK